MAKKEIKTAIQMQASPAQVWEVLTAFDNYKSWNPFITSIEGIPKKGSQLKINAGGMNFKPIVLVAEKNKELRWLGKLFVKGLFDGEHIFLIEDNLDGTVTFRQEEKFSGILVGLFAGKLDTDTKAGFVQMNQRLKELAEAKKAASIGK